MYLNFVDGQANNSCYYYDQLIADIRSMAPLLTIIGSPSTGPDFGHIWSEPYGYLTGYEDLGLAMTLLNVSQWTALEEVLAIQPNVTVSITPCKSFLFVYTFVYHFLSTNTSL
jgi:hypothetical protein